MTPEELNSRIQAVVSDIQSGAHADVMVSTANVALALIKRRILQSGINAQGQSFCAYSKWYDEYKTNAGKNKGYTDFSFTNRMWNNIQLAVHDSNSATITALDKGASGGRQQVQVKGSGKRKAHSRSVYVPSNYEKLEMNTERFGVILDLSEEEKQKVMQVYNDGIVDIFKRNGLGLEL